MSKLFLILPTSITLLVGLFFFSFTQTASAVGGNNIGIGPIYLEIKDEKTWQGGIHVEVTIKDMNSKETIYTETYNNPTRCGVNGWENPCMGAKEIPIVKKGGAPTKYEVSYNILHLLPSGQVDQTGTITCQNNNCGPFQSVMLGQSVGKSKALWTPPTAISPTIQLTQTELSKGESAMGTVIIFDQRYKYRVAVESGRRVDGTYEFSKFSDFTLNSAKTDCSFEINNLNIKCNSPVSIHSSNPAVVAAFSLDWSTFPEKLNSATYTAKVTLLDKQTGFIIPPNPIASAGLKVNPITAPKQDLEITVLPPAITANQDLVETQNNIAIQVSKATPRNKYNFRIDVSNGQSKYIPDIVAGGETFQINFPIKENGLFLYTTTNDKPTDYTIVVTEQGSPKTGEGKLTVNPAQVKPPGSVTVPTCETGKTCTSAAGIPCDITSNTPPVRGQTIAPDNVGVYTAIGCIPTEPTALVQGIIKFAIAGGSGIAFLLMIAGAFQMMTSGGNPDGVKKGHEQITSAVIGLLFIIFAVMLLKVIGVDILQIPGFQP